MNDSFSLVRLFVLGALDARERHGYEIVALAETWAIHRWTGISIGSIYSTLKSLAKDAFIDVAGTEREGNRPERQRFRLTTEGEVLFLKLTAMGLSALNFEGREVDLALAFAHRIGPEQRRAALEGRVPHIRERRQQLEHFASAYEKAPLSDDPNLAEFRQLRLTSPWIYSSIRHGLERLRVEEAWTASLIDEIDSWPYQPHNSLHTRS